MNEAPMPLSPAPGARGAKLCGIWSLVTSATCVGIPVGLVLAVIALVQQAKAKRLAKENPDLYEPPTATGLLTGIIGLAMPVVMLPFLGIVSAIVIPAVIAQRQHTLPVQDEARIEALGLGGELEFNKVMTANYGSPGEYEWKVDGTSQSGPRLVPGFHPKHFDYLLTISDGDHYHLAAKNAKTGEVIWEMDQAAPSKAN